MCFTVVVLKYGGMESNIAARRNQEDAVKVANNYRARTGRWAKVYDNTCEVVHDTQWETPEVEKEEVTE
jgi:cytochrome c5